MFIAIIRATTKNNVKGQAKKANRYVKLKY